MNEYAKKELLHTAFAVGVTVVIAIASDLMAIQSFQEVSIVGLAVTAVRSLATAVVTLGSRFVVR